MKNILKILCLLLLVLLVPLQAKAYGSYPIDYNHYDVNQWTNERHRDLLELKEGIHDYRIENSNREQADQLRIQNELIREQNRLINQRH